jgi:hypothetical protein
MVVTDCPSFSLYNIAGEYVKENNTKYRRTTLNTAEQSFVELAYLKLKPIPPKFAQSFYLQWLIQTSCEL